MSAMVAYEVGLPAPAKEVYESWLEYFEENRRKLIGELKYNTDTKYKELRELGIVTNERVTKINQEFKNIYKNWNINTVSNKKREIIIKQMRNYIFKLKKQLEKERMVLKTKEKNKHLYNLAKEELDNITSQYLKEIKNEFQIDNLEYIKDILQNMYKNLNINNINENSVKIIKSKMKEYIINLKEQFNQEIKEKKYKEGFSYFETKKKNFFSNLEKYLKNGVLQKEELYKIKQEFESLYKEWNIENIDENLQKKILQKIDNYIFNLHKNLEAKHIEMIIAKELEEEFNNQKEIIFQSIVNKYIQKDNLDILEKLKQYDENKYNAYLQQLKNLDNKSQKYQLLLKNIKIDIEKDEENLTQNKLYEEEIEDLYLKVEKYLTNDIIEHINNLKQSKQYEEILTILEEEYIKIKNKQKIIKQIIVSLKKINYLEIDEEKLLENFLSNKKTFLAVKNNKSYQVAITLNKNNKLLTRFIKNTDEEIGLEEKLQDKESLSKWCNIQKKFAEIMSENGIKNSFEILEDENEDILYIKTNSNLEMKGNIKTFQK